MISGDPARNSNNDTAPSYYGFSFKGENAGGLGAALHALMLARHYAKVHGLPFALVREGMEFPRLNGSIDDLPEEAPKNFNSYFSSFPYTVSNAEMLAVWRNCVPGKGYSSNPPAGQDRVAWYKTIMGEIFQLVPTVQEQVAALVAQSGFQPATDVVLHVRRTDKIAKFGGSVVESAELPLPEYVHCTLRVLRKLDHNLGLRVFLCTDDKDIIQPLTVAFEARGYPLVYDASEPADYVQALRIGGKLSKSEAWKENLRALANLTIMSRGLFLVGGRMSYFFRVAELLRTGSTTLNIKDQEMFGKAPYAEPGEPFANPFLKGRYTDFVSDAYKVDRPDLQTTIDAQYLVTARDFMSEGACATVLSDMTRFQRAWWRHAVVPNEKGRAALHLAHDDERLPHNIAMAEKAAADGQFAYYFKRSTGGHYDTCTCFACRLKFTFESFEVMKALSNMVGKRVVSMGETFASLYERDNFLTMHHDKAKGDYTFILSLTKNWNLVHGGTTHFYDAPSSSITHSVSPVFNCITIFKLLPEHQMDHFVSRVWGNGSRYAFTGWFNVEK